MNVITCIVWTDCGENEDGYEVECTFAKCSECGHKTQSYGTSERSSTTPP